MKRLFLKEQKEEEKGKAKNEEEEGDKLIRIYDCWCAFCWRLGKYRKN